MTEWQPIETAPKDRTIIGWSEYLFEPATFQWDELITGSGWQPAHDDSYVIASQGDWGTDYKDHEILTHWMPLPEPPK